MQLRLPHPWYTDYTIRVAAFDDGLRQFQVQPSSSRAGTGRQQLHKDDLLWTEPELNTVEETSQDTTKLWARQEQIPTSTFIWTESRPSIGQAWLATYALISLYPKTDSFQIRLQGDKAAEVGDELSRIGLLVKSHAATTPPDYFLFRGSFWQGAGSPFGSRPVWLAEPTSADWEFPPLPLQKAHLRDQGDDASFATTVRPPKPDPGAVVYSRHIPHLDATLSLVALDASNTQHHSLFSAWNRHGTPDHHYRYLQSVHRDPTALPLLAKLGDEFLAYFEVYWVKERVEDHIGVHFAAAPHDRGCSALFPAAADRAVAHALWSAVVHYAFLDEPRTASAFGAPRYVDAMVVGYEGEFPFSATRRVDAGGAEEALAVCSREMFFQVCPFAAEGQVPEWRGERGGDGGVMELAGEGRELLAKL